MGIGTRHRRPVAVPFGFGQFLIDAAALGQIVEIGFVEIGARKSGPLGFAAV